MHIILVPGLWLDASSWRDVAPALEAAGHRTHPLTMPGVGASSTDSAGIGMADWVAATVAQIDHLDGPVVLVGHSGGGPVVQQVQAGSADAVNAASWRIGTQWMFTPPADPMRADPRFLPLCDGVGLTDYWRKRGVKPDYMRAQP